VKTDTAGRRPREDDRGEAWTTAKSALTDAAVVCYLYVFCFLFNSIVRIFRTVNQKTIEHPSIECRALSKSGIYCMRIITSYDLNPFIVNVPQRHLVTNAHLKFWGYGAFYSTLFTVKEIMSIIDRVLQRVGG
jgi:hypothetical protein